MAVYVDNFNAKYGRMTMCHMMADSEVELINMAKIIGINTKWLQSAVGKRPPHFDICLSKKKTAIENGVIEVSCRELVRRFPTM